MPLGHGGSLSWDEGITGNLSQMRRQSIHERTLALAHVGAFPCP